MYSIFFIILSFGFFQAEKPMANPDAFEKKFLEVSESTKSIACDFTQKKYVSFSKNPLESSGKMWYQDQKMRWEQNSPESYIMVINEETITIKEDGKIDQHPLNENKMMKGLKEIMLGSITGSFFKSKQFETVLLQNKKHNIIKLVPKVKRVKKMFSEIKMYFDPETYRMDKLIMSEPSGDYTELAFSEATFDKTIPPAKFTLK